jgi:hypothetical protein
MIKVRSVVRASALNTTDLFLHMLELGGGNYSERKPWIIVRKI